MYLFQIIKQHVIFHKAEYVGYLEPALTDDTTIDQQKLTNKQYNVTEDDGRAN